LRKEKGEASALFSRIDQQTISTNYQGLWLIAPDGKVLTAFSGTERPPDEWSRMLLADLRAGMRKFGTVSPRRASPTNPLPYRGIGVRADGSVTLAMSDRIFRRNPPGEHYLGSVGLPSAAWSAFGPPEPRANSTWEFPEATARAFFSILNFHDKKFYSSDEVTRAQFTGRVVSVEDGIAFLAYRGEIAGEHDGKAESRPGVIYSHATRIVDGVGTYDIKAGQMLALTWVGEGLVWDNLDPSKNREGQPYRFGVVLEWRRGDPKATLAPEGDAPSERGTIELLDSTPENALKTFLLALAARDEASLRAVTLPAKDFDLLLRGPVATPDQLVQLKAHLEEKPIRRLRAGDPVKMPNGEERVISPDDVRENRVALWLDGEPLPARLEKVGGHWKVFAGTFIAARRATKSSQIPATGN
jgi:hypothetical protein